ncbi:ABC transporter substrate-binding protein [Citricoccus muralis]|uniref:ABC transporter substrate-binding protein n=1 Tax=Citricoccus muralis TaxID=169134 RepID=A0ABY8H6F7_9MICC|nr:ABC transporter substrate-binding protein [Citricoccus muralis]WFP16232.1 ABC transporter substrate-binding protein [Citricoccus muralis]
MSPRPHQSPKKLIALTLAASMLALSACGGNASGGDSVEADQVLKWAPRTSPWSWDPVVQGSGFQFNQLALAYASLTEINEDGEAVPGLAESWEYNEAGDAVTFTLREGLVFQDDTPLDAEAVKSYVERAIEQEDSALANDLDSIDHITADSEREVTFHLTQVDHQIPLLLGRRVALITSPEADPDDLTQTPVGAGPFTPVEIVPDSHAYFEKNPDYWNADEINIDRVEIHWGIDEASLVPALQTGTYNFADLPPAQAQAAENSDFDVVTHPGFNAANITINHHLEPFDDPAVLEAARYAIDRDELVDAVTFGYGEPVSQPFPEGYLAWSPEVEDPWPYDPEKAKEILEDAGYEEGEVSVNFAVRDDAPANEIIQSQLADVGINLNLQIIPNWEQPFFAKELPISTYSTTGRESPVQTLTAHFGADGPLNGAGEYENDEFLEAVALARETPLDSPDYEENLQKATELGVLNSPTIFTYSQPNIFGQSGISELPQVPGQIHWEGVTIEE